MLARRYVKKQDLAPSPDPFAAQEGGHFSSVESDGDDNLEPGAGRHTQMDVFRTGALADDVIGDGARRRHSAFMPCALLARSDTTQDTGRSHKLECPLQVPEPAEGNDVVMLKPSDNDPGSDPDCTRKC
jgi:hypothetical protein